MKKLILIVSLMALGCIASAQNYFQMYIDDIEPDHIYEFCFQDYDGVVIVDTICNYSYEFHWMGGSVNGTYDFEEWGPVLTLIPDDGWNYGFLVVYKSDEGDRLSFQIKFYGFSSQDPWFPDYVWKHEDEVATLVAPNNATYYHGPYYWYYEWSTGETLREIEVANPGIYWARLYNFCGEAIDSVEVRNGVEISLASTDLASNMNRVNWLVDEAQSEYLTEVNIYRNNQLVGTAQYADSSFFDNIGSEATQWQYHIVGVTTDGEECPVSSYWKRPIHLDHMQGQSNRVLQWTSYEAEDGADVVAYKIYDWVDGELRLVTEVGGFVNTFNYNPEEIMGDAVVAAVFSSGELSYSNRVPIHLGIDESYDNQFYVYPNPAKDRVTVEGTGMAIITNTLGQTILTREINGKETIELPQGLYFVKMNGVTRKVVVE